MSSHNGKQFTCIISFNPCNNRGEDTVIPLLMEGKNLKKKKTSSREVKNFEPTSHE